jgi:hypothetical protein
MTVPELPTLHPQLAAISWLVGIWEGVGVGGYPGVEDFQFGQALVIEHDERPILFHDSRTWLIDSATGEPGRPLAAERGFWRLPDPQAEVELVLAHGSGVVEIWLGRVTGQSVELATDVVARTASATEVTGGHRLYGLVDGDLLWSYDMAAEGQPLQPHLSARLRRAR